MHTPNEANNQTIFIPCQLEDLPRDMKRMLSVQIREFVHFIEDCECESTLESNTRVIQFLEDCLAA